MIAVSKTGFKKNEGAKNKTESITALILVSLPNNIATTVAILFM